MSVSFGSPAVHAAVQDSQRVANRQQGLGSMGEVISPRIRMRSRRLCRLGIGSADSSALVYGCVGFLNSSSVFAFSIILPRYITAISSEM